MYLVEILLPLNANDGTRFSSDRFAGVRRELVERFGGVTAFTRSPAVGLWQPDTSEAPAKDDIVIYQVTVDSLDRNWWTGYRRKMEQEFRQKSVMIRATEFELL